MPRLAWNSAAHSMAGWRSRFAELFSPHLAPICWGKTANLSREEQLDVLCEIANVICGNMLPEIGGPRAVFNIEPPQLCQVGQAASGCSESPAAEARIGLERGRAELFLYLKGNAGIETNPT